MTASAGRGDAWIRVLSAPSKARMSLYCFPHAGGAASAFRGWASAAASHVEVCAVALPGREERFRESAEFELVDIADAIAGRARLPFAFVGHSMGALVGYEVQRLLLARGRPAANELWLSAAGSPDHSGGQLTGAATWPADTLIAEMVRLGGLHPLLAADPNAAELFLPALRADLQWVDEYQHRGPIDLATPIVAVVGREDPLVSISQACDWAHYTTGPFHLRVISGGHFAAYEQAEALSAAVGEAVLLASEAGNRTVAGASRSGRTTIRDLSHRVSPEQPNHPANGPPSVKDVASYGVDGCLARRWLLDEHCGTHVDAPAHFGRGELTVDDLPADELVLNAVIIDIRGRVHGDPDAELLPSDILDWERRFGPITIPSIVIAFTGWSERYDRPEMYLGVDGAGCHHWPGIAERTAAFLARQRPAVRALGIDGPSLDTPPGEDRGSPTHLRWLASGRYAVENLANLKELPPAGASLFVGVPRLQRGSGSTARVVAMLPAHAATAGGAP
jgi:surfactin synthase thioesterase subunit/kynurenine formamidase